MHILRNSSLAVLLGMACVSQAMPSAIPSDKKLEVKVEKTVSKMTPDEKRSQRNELMI